MLTASQIYLVEIFAFICSLQALPFTHNYDPVKCGGLNPTACAEVIDCVKEVRVQSALALGQKLSKDDLEDTVRLNDMLLNPVQCNALLDTLKLQKLEKMGFFDKRKIIDYAEFPLYKWDLPIPYMINSTDFDTEEEQELIRDAFRHWEERTCIKFKELPYSETYPVPYIEVIDDGGCYSGLGKEWFTSYNMQPLSLGQYCLDVPGIPIHEIGHTLGLTHEQQRPDRNKYIRILEENVDPDFASQFVLEFFINDLGVPYDFASVMHYGSRFFSANGNRTMETLDPDYQYTIGNRDGTTFHDITLINRAYGCLDPQSVNSPPGCKNPTITCYNGGYPDPGGNNDCQVCKCPNGLGGDCRTAAEGNPGCTPLSSDLEVTSEVQYLMSPGYELSPWSKYEAGDHCSWLLKAPERRTITLYFDMSEKFSVTPAEETCYHYVEMKHKGNLTESGARYCGSKYYEFNQNSVITSADNQVLVNFRSDIDYWSTVQQEGFKLAYFLTESEEEETTSETPGVTSTTSITTGDTTPEHMKCLVCTKQKKECNNPKFLEECPAGTKGCYTSTTYTQKGKVGRVTKGCTPAWCDNDGYIVDAKYIKTYFCTRSECNMNQNSMSYEEELMRMLQY